MFLWHLLLDEISSPPPQIQRSVCVFCQSKFLQSYSNNVPGCTLVNECSGSEPFVTQLEVDLIHETGGVQNSGGGKGAGHTSPLLTWTWGG